MVYNIHAETPIVFEGGNKVGTAGSETDAFRGQLHGVAMDTIAASKGRWVAALTQRATEIDQDLRRTVEFMNQFSGATKQAGHNAEAADDAANQYLHALNS